MNCPKCHTSYSKSIKPHVLSCGHTFCSTCLPLSLHSKCLTCNQQSKPAINFALYEQLNKYTLDNIRKFVKVCFFGNIAVGKTSLLRRLVDGEFTFETSPTIGIDMKFVDRDVKGMLCRFQMWDSAGQEKYRALCSDHLKSADIVLLVYDISSTHEKNTLSYWIDQLQKYTKHNNIIVIGNKTDLLHSQSQQQDKKPPKPPLTPTQHQHISQQNWSHLQLSCKSNEGINQLWEVLQKTSSRLKGKSMEEKKSSIILGDEKGMGQGREKVGGGNGGSRCGC